MDSLELALLAKSSEASSAARGTKEAIVYQDDNIDVYHMDNGGPILLILFCEMGFSSRTQSWGGAAAAAAGFSYLGFVSKKPNWFPRSSIMNARSAVKSILENHSSIVTYGHSQGGYASIKYSGEFHATAILSFCPQYSISPLAMKGIDRRFWSYFPGDDEHQPIKAGDVPPSSKLFVFYDPRDILDGINFGHIRESTPMATAIKVFGTGHNTIRPFAGHATLRELVHSALSGDELRIRKIARLCKRKWAGRKIYMARELATRNSTAAISLIEGALDKLNPEVAPDLAKNLMSMGQYDYLTKRADSFDRNLGTSDRKILIEAFLAGDRIGDALQLASIHAFIHKDRMPDIFDLISPHDKIDHTRLPIAFPVYCEGWHDAETWGRWGSSTRSRLCLDLNNLPKNCSAVRIPVEVFRPMLQSLTARVFSKSGCLAVKIENNEIVLKREWGAVVVDFHVSRLFSPFQLHVNDDRRLLGTSLKTVESWVFV